MGHASWNSPFQISMRFGAYVHNVKISKSTKFQASISNSFWDIAIKSLDHSPSLSSSQQPSWKFAVVHCSHFEFGSLNLYEIGAFINFGVRNPKIALKSFTKQKKVLKFWKKNFFSWNSMYLSNDPHNINFPFLPKPDQTNSLLEWKLYT